MLSKRLKTIADLVIDSKSLADIGTDHGLIPAELLKRNPNKNIILCDINAKPLKRAKTLLQEYGLISSTDFRLGDGLNVINNGEVEQAIIAGMGGEMISRILSQDLDKSHSINYFILQPMTHVYELRKFLVDNNFNIVKDLVVKDTSERKNRYFHILVVENGPMEKPDEMQLIFGIQSVVQLDQDYLSYLEYEMNRYGTYIQNMLQSNNEQTQSRRLEYERRFNFLKEYYESLSHK